MGSGAISPSILEEHYKLLAPPKYGKKMSHLIIASLI